ncbi:MAG: hypothetical protein GFH27_549279n57 [Chloroflexi bacterium AL-W]|nr:hypothetical protein [Chloroflexi bacterium AL-N10]NOK79202.1 hypothetical protein [Chloroflexi bacterium AL-W]NOK87118.1 hypothetical protein [Chloroflexi bacterium AL-N15]
MTTAKSFIHSNIPAMTPRLQRALDWFILLAIFTGSLEGGLFVFTESPIFVILAMVSYFAGGMGIWVRWLVGHNRINTALLLFWLSLALVMLLVTILIPSFWPVTTLGTLLITVIVLPYLNLIGVRWLLTSTYFLGILTIVLGYLPSPIALSIPSWDLTFILIGSSVIVFAFLVFLLGQFSNQLLETITRIQKANTALEAAQTHLETQVVERTVHLQEALTTIEKRETQLHTTIADLQTSQMTIRELSAPIIPVAAQVLVAPLIGAIDSNRATIFTDMVLTAVEKQRTRLVILDITGVPVIDTQVAQVLVQTADAIRLLGAHVTLVGIRPEVAQTIVGLGVNLGDIQTHRDLEQALSFIHH